MATKNASQPAPRDSVRGVAGDLTTRPPATGAILLLGGAALGAIAFSYQTSSFLHVKEAVTFGAAALAALFLFRHSYVQPRHIRWFLPCWVFLAIHGLLRPLLLPPAYPPAAFETAVYLFLALGTATLMAPMLEQPPLRRAMTGAFLGAAGLAAVLGLGQYTGWLDGLFPVFEEYPQRMYSVFGNQDLLGGYLAMALPLAAYVFLAGKTRNALYLAFIAVLLFTLALSASRSAWLAAAIGLTVALVTTGAPWGKRAALGLLTLIIAAAAVTAAPDATWRRAAQTLTGADDGGRLRIWFWDAALRMTADAPILGHGLGHYAYWSPVYQGDALRGPLGEWHAYNEIHTHHAHADPLELSAETGFIGLLLAAWALVRLRKSRGPAWGPFSALLVFALLNFPMSSIAHLLPGLLLYGELARQRSADASVSVDAPSPSRRLLNWGIALTFPIVTVAYLSAVLPPSYWMRQGDDLTLATEPAHEVYERAARHWWPAPLAYQKLGYAWAGERAWDEAGEALDNALDGLDTGAVHLMRGIVAYHRKEHETARKHLEACIHRWPANQHGYVLLLALTPETEWDNWRAEGERWLGAQGWTEAKATARRISE